MKLVKIKMEKPQRRIKRKRIKGNISSIGVYLRSQLTIIPFSD